MNEKLAAIIVHDIKNTLGMLESELRQMTAACERADALPVPVPAQVPALALADDESQWQEPQAPSLRQRAVHAHATCLNLQDRLVGFLTLYKASSQGLRPDIEPVPPEPFLHALLEQLQAASPGVTLSLEVDAMPAVAFFDENLIALALEAALRNALRFARSCITVGCIQHADYLSFTVADDGPGLGATKGKNTSTGLGMELCSAIAVAHIRNDRTGAALLGNRPEGGALFELRLP